MDGTLRLRIIAAAATEDGWGIGYQGGMPWPRIPADMRHFEEITTTTSDGDLLNAVIMGRKTWESIPAARRPLPGRRNIVISSTMEEGEGYLLARDFEDALRLARGTETAYVIGGASVYAAALYHPACDGADITVIRGGAYATDVAMPDLSDDARYRADDETADMTSGGVTYAYRTYSRVQ